MKVLSKESIFEQDCLDRRFYNSDRIYRMIKKEQVPFNILSKDSILDLILKHDMTRPRKGNKYKRNCTNFYKLENFDVTEDKSNFYNLSQLENIQIDKTESPFDTNMLEQTNNFLFLLKGEQARSENSNIHQIEDSLKELVNMNQFLPKTNQNSYNNLALANLSFPSTLNKLTNTILNENNEVKPELQGGESPTNLIRNISFSLDNECLFDLDGASNATSKFKSFNCVDKDMLKGKDESHKCNIKISRQKVKNALLSFEKFKSFCENGNVSGIKQEKIISSNNLNDSRSPSKVFTISPKSAYVKNLFK